jgi:hypothetical protein
VNRADETINPYLSDAQLSRKEEQDNVALLGGAKELDGLFVSFDQGARETKAQVF